MTNVAYGDHGHVSKSLVLTDQIVAFGQPDAALAKELGANDSIAFIGKKHTYMLSSGGKQLLQVAQLKLDPDRIEIDAADSKKLFLEDNRVWGHLTVTYDGGQAVSPEERSELTKARFHAKGSGENRFYKSLKIAGTVYPAVKYADVPMPKLKKRRVVNFYADKYEGPSVVGKILKTPLVVVGVALDVALLPVYVMVLAR